MWGRGVMCVCERDTIDRQTDSLRAIGRVCCHVPVVLGSTGSYTHWSYACNGDARERLCGGYWHLVIESIKANRSRDAQMGDESISGG